MYLIDREKNRISRLEEKTFSELKFKEREHLQEWIANNPSSLGEELLIIQKEFSGFGETNERLDLLALDKVGNLVIIENGTLRDNHLIKLITLMVQMKLFHYTPQGVRLPTPLL